jgi:CSLREA domain-containing protein
MTHREILLLKWNRAIVNEAFSLFRVLGITSIPWEVAMKTLRLALSIFLIMMMQAIITAMRPLVPQSPGASISVTITADEYGGLSTGCSLREAITAANTNTTFGGCTAGSPIGGDTILLPAGTYSLTRAGPNEDGNTTGDLDITSDLTITGQVTGATIQAGGIDRALDILSGASATLNNLTITGGHSPNGKDGEADGGGIRNGGILTLNYVIVTGNQAGDGTGGGADGADGGDGGGIYSNGSALTIINSTISDNLAGTGEDSTTYGHGGNGGGLSTDGGTTTITNSTIRDNTAGPGGISNTYGFGGKGGGCFFTGTSTITGSTISGNTAGSSPSYNGGDGGGIYANSSVTLINSTVSGNVSGSSTAVNRYPGNGGGLTLSAPTLIRYSTIYDNHTGTGTYGARGGGISSQSDHYITLGATILAGNSAPGSIFPDCYTTGTVISEDYNLIGDPTGCTIDDPVSHSFLGVPGYTLPALAKNGGPTQTHALLAGNQALDQIVYGALGCGTTYTIDQRGETRPDFSLCDMGAFELQTNYLLDVMGFMPLIAKP